MFNTIISKNIIYTTTFLLILFSCNKSKVIDTSSDMIDVQAIIYEVEEYNFFLNKRWRIKYTYNYKGNTYKGGKGSFNFLLSIGQPIVVKVDTLNPNNSIYYYFGLKKELLR